MSPELTRQDLTPRQRNYAFRLDSWPVPPLFKFIQQRGSVAADEVARYFNMGIGMFAIVAAEYPGAPQSAGTEETFTIGKLVPGQAKVGLL